MHSGKSTFVSSNYAHMERLTGTVRLSGESEGVRESLGYGEIYTDEFIRPVVESLETVVVGNESLIKLSLPSIHRVQKVYGPVWNIDLGLFRRSVEFDLSEFVGIENVAEIVDKSLFALSNAEAILAKIGERKAQFITSESGLEYQEVKDMVDSMVARCVWRTWTLGFGDTDSLAESLVLKVMGNVRYLERNLIRQRKKTDSFGPEDRDYYLGTAKYGVSPSAEAVYVDCENEAEFIEAMNHLSESEVYSLYLDGHSTSGIAQMTGVDLNEVSGKISELSIWAKDLLREKYCWMEVPRIFDIGESLASGKSNGLRIDPGSVFKGMDMSEVFSRIAQLPSGLQRKCLLHRIGYLGPEFQTTEDWLKEQKIGHELYLKEVYEGLQLCSDLRGCGKETQNLRELVKDAEAHVIVNFSTGRIATENNSVVIIRDRFGNYPDFSLTGDERDLIGAVCRNSDIVSVPTAEELSRELGWSKGKTESLLYRVARLDFDTPRYAAKAYVIDQSSQRHRLISWARENGKNNRRYQVCGLTTQQSEFYSLSTTTRENWYLSEDEISKAWGVRYGVRGLMDWGSKYERIFETLESESLYWELYKLVKRGVKKDLPGKQRIVYEAILERMKQLKPLATSYLDPWHKSLNISRSLLYNVIENLEKDLMRHK